ncbi:MAG: hypothetical protein COA71_08420 [SAR86 cluster bacterium]|uniref:Uncharacterized protein n=1 Tax=SAR86 cluster bacterium TaxID=2030880 RepID=A0A2A5CCJ0_9GAMM|nr:MAG: hypothetical protein COA71_08420 [SAR86 cluster bacterium]
MISRRQSLKLMAGAGLLSVMPLTLGATYARESRQAFVIANEDGSGDVFGRAINASLNTSLIQIDHKNYASLMSLAHLPKGALLIGLVNDAEKVLIDAHVQDRRGVINTTARISTPVSSTAMISGLAEMTLQAALTGTHERDFENTWESVREREITTRALISFYAYL